VSMPALSGAVAGDEFPRVGPAENKSTMMAYQTEVKLRWPLLPVILTSGLPRERVGELPLGVDYMPKPWRPLNVLIAAEQALASGQGN
jgi:hypothetical protein